jgi:EAL domain-containing protein (putative c-di-GMP-specific phosphodiesterase class I)
VIAEGVETAPQIELLRALECDYIQGFYYSEAVPEHVATNLARRGLAAVEKAPTATR